MHAVGLHSALAIKRQRKCREQLRRAKERRYSSQSGESGLTSPRASTASLDHRLRSQRKLNSKKQNAQGIDSKVVTSIGMLHVGIVFLVSGGFLLSSGLLPNDVTAKVTGSFFNQWNELITVGMLLIIIGCFLLFINSIIAKSEEKELEEYVQRQLTRSKSGHRLERDAETGSLITKHAKRMKKCRNKDEHIYNLTQEKNNILPQSQTEITNMKKKSNTLFNDTNENRCENEKKFEQNCLNHKSYIPLKSPLDNSFNCTDSCEVQLHYPLCKVSKI